MTYNVFSGTLNPTHTLLSCCRKGDNELAEVTLSGRLFQNCAAAFWKVTKSSTFDNTGAHTKLK